MKIKLKNPFRSTAATSARAYIDYSIYCIKSLMFNQHLSQGYVADVLMEPLIKVLDGKFFRKVLGPLFVVVVIVLTSIYVFICYWIGLPWFWRRSQELTIVLLIVGNWLLVNVVFHYYMAVTTDPGSPPTNQTYNAVSICKKCSMPKPPRTHHCSVCKRCIMKFDHHCPFINNCVGFYNHRYFFSYMAFTVTGVLFVVTFGLPLGYEVLIQGDGGGWQEMEELVGNPVKFNSTGHMKISNEIDYADLGLSPVQHDLPDVERDWSNEKLVFSCIVFMAIVSFAVILALGFLTVWHFRLISNGETSVEYYINKAEKKRLTTIGREFTNPYDCGRRSNFKFLFWSNRRR